MRNQHIYNNIHDFYPHDFEINTRGEYCGDFWQGYQYGVCCSLGRIAVIEKVPLFNDEEMRGYNLGYLHGGIHYKEIQNESI